MEFIFWIIIVVAVIFGGLGMRLPALAPYAPWPALVLFIILGYKVFGFPH